MPYDIYGNKLKKGHCEVHPDVPEEYPCNYCLLAHEQEKIRQQQEEEYYKYIEDEMAQALHPPDPEEDIDVPQEE